ncbi:alpha-aminoadipic semialdehyde synthase [Iris pallida]|uniref:Alpha-aminoadipic semialdehyde synthase n=1 Tax=Iris pallida TaxID=29817 RepID=A0AAX6DLW3_IRIPA|nr:alpha-aminoadipic semialdehyde synthase [Iris pallida]
MEIGCLRQVGADDSAILDKIVDSLTSLATPTNKEKELSVKFGKINECVMEAQDGSKARPSVLILGAGRVCRPAAEFLASIGNASSAFLKNSPGINIGEVKEFQVIVASLYLKDAEEVIDGISNTTAIELDVKDYGSLSKYISQVEVVLSLLPPSFHAVVANSCIEHKKHLVTASYVDDSVAGLDEKAKGAGVTILSEMGLDPGIDHMMAMKMINQARARKGKIRAFSSFCGGLPSPAAANNPLAYKFSWNPAGAIRAGRNPATYKSFGEIIHLNGNELYDSATVFNIADLPAFALEYLPNRNSLVYGDLYGISKEASTIFRATLRYQGFSQIMSCLAKIGFFETEVHPLLKQGQRPTFKVFLSDLLKSKFSNSVNVEDMEGIIGNEKEMIALFTTLGLCKETAAMKTIKTIKFLGLHENVEIPATCSSAFDVACLRMEQKLSYSANEQDMVLLHHEVEVEFPDGRPSENHRATLLEFGRTENGKTTTAMALTVGIPAAIGALLLLQNKVQTRGVIRPLNPEVYIPALDILEASGIKLPEKVEIL